MGNEAAIEACGVFEAYMSSFALAVGLEQDMYFVLDILDEWTTYILKKSVIEVLRTVVAVDTRVPR